MRNEELGMRNGGANPFGICFYSIDVAMALRKNPIKEIRRISSLNPQSSLLIPHYYLELSLRLRHYHLISAYIITGPSVQMRLWPVIVSQVHPMQAPKPQPMRASNEN